MNEELKKFMEEIVKESLLKIDISKFIKFNKCTDMIEVDFKYQREYCIDQIKDHWISEELRKINVKRNN